MYQSEESVETASGQFQVVSHVEHDGLGRPVLQAKRRVGTLSTAYNGNETDFHHKTSHYDGRGTVWRQSDWRASPDHGAGDAGAVVVETVDPWGRTEKALASDDSRTEISYSGTWRSDARVFDAGGATPLSRTVTDFDARGNTVRVLEDKNTTTLSEDLTTPSSADFVISEHTFDVSDRLTEVAVTGRDASGAQRTQLRSYDYDPRGFLIGESFPELGPGSISYCLHDADGRPGRSALGATFAQCLSAGPSDGVIDTFADAGGRPLQSWAKQDGDWYLMSEIEYGDDPLENSVGQPVRSDRYNTVVWPTPAVDPALHIDPQSIRVRHLHTYNGPQGLLSRRVTEVAFGGTGSGGVQAFELGYSYDLWGNLALVQYPRLDDLNSCAPAHDVRYAFDTMGLLGIKEKFAGDFTADLLAEPAYDLENGMMTGWSTASGIGASSMVRHTIIPDGTRLRVGRIIAETEGTPTGTFFDSGNYTFDGRGNVDAIAGSAFTAGWSYSYDALSRLVSATSATTRSFTFDDLGNLTAAGGQSITVDPATNRLSAAGAVYDARGSLTHQPVVPGWTRRMRFDAFDRLVAAWSEGASAPEDAYVFAYDHAGERVLRYRVEEDTVQEATFSLRDEAGNVLSELLWTPEVEGGDTGGWTRIVDTAYLGRRPLVQMSSTPEGDRQYTTLVTDHLDSIRAEVYDAEPAAVSANSLDYWPFGEVVSHPPTLKTHHLFTAHEREFTGSATGVNTMEGVDYMHARYYNPTLGRFLSVDPIGGEVGSSQSWNRYSYVYANPVNWVDPKGLTARRWGSRGGMALFADDEELVVTARDPHWDALEAWAQRSAFISGTTDDWRARMDGGEMVAFSGGGPGALLAPGVGVGAIRKIRGIRDVFTKARRFFWDPRPFSTISRGYWAARGGAGTRSLHHWLLPQRMRWMPLGLRNAGFNLLDMPSLRGVFHSSLGLNQWMGFASRWGPAAARRAAIAENSIRAGVPIFAAGEGAAAYHVTVEILE